MSSSSGLRRSSREIRHYYQSVARRIRTPGQPWHPPAQREWSRIRFASSYALTLASSFLDASYQGRWLLQESNVSEFEDFSNPSFVFHARKSPCHNYVRRMAIVIVFHPICYGLTFSYLWVRSLILERVWTLVAGLTSEHWSYASL